MSSRVPADFDDILENIAKEIFKDTEINYLGKSLGFELADIGRCIDANARQGGNYMGTLDMLRTWRRRQAASTERAALSSALENAGLKHLVDKHLSTPKPGQEQASATSTSGLERVVTDKELWRLAGNLHANYYTPVAINLGVPHTDYENIKRENVSSLKDATFQMLKKWKYTKTGGKVGDLDEALHEAECGGISYKNV